MYIKYSPIKSNRETSIIVKDNNTIIIDNEEYEFDVNSILFPNVNVLTNYVIIDAYRENKELYLTIQRHYIDSNVWDDTKYHEVLA